MKVLDIIDMFLFLVILFMYEGMSYCCINHQIYLEFFYWLNADILFVNFYLSISYGTGGCYDN